jgi:hypothetical protein
MKKFIKNLIAKIATLFKAIAPRYKTALTVAVNVIDALDAAIKNPAADIFVAITPIPGDDMMLKWLRVYLPNFLLQFKLFAQLSHLTDTQEIIIKASEILQGLDQHDRNGERLKLATALAMDIAADGKIDWADAVKIVQALKDKSI